MKAYISWSEEETKKIGRSILSYANEKGIRVILISGELGSGKTILVKGMGTELGISEDEITSPTFTISQEYISEKGKLLHIDLYRIEDDDIAELLYFVADKIKDGYITVFEWGEKIDKFIPWEKILVKIDVMGGDNGNAVREIKLID